VLPKAIDELRYSSFTRNRRFPLLLYVLHYYFFIQ